MLATTGAMAISEGFEGWSDFITHFTTKATTFDNF